MAEPRDNTPLLLYPHGELNTEGLKAFVRSEMLQFLRDMGWLTGELPPPLRGTTAPTATASDDNGTGAAERFPAESAQMQSPKDGRTRAERLRERLSPHLAEPFNKGES
jgi:hypothetical protein